MWNSYIENEKIWLCFVNANSKVALAKYDWTLDLEIIGHTEIIIEC